MTGTTTPTKFEDLLELIGTKGRWQYRTFFFLWIEGIIIGFHHLSSVFLGYTPGFWCSDPDISYPGSWTPDQIKNYTVPVDSGGKFETCFMYNLTGVNINSDFSTAMIERVGGVKGCSNYEYNKDMGITIVSEWDLVCDRTALLSTVQGSYMGGVFVGCIFWGWCSDKFGRRPSILVSCLFQIFSSVAAAFSVNYIMFIFFRFFVAFSVSGVFECGFVLVTEIVSAELRTPFGIMTQFPFGIGASLLPLVAYFIKDWQPLQLAISIPSILLVTYYWFIPESPRWLVSENRYPEALQVLKEAAKINGNSLPSDEEMLDLLENIAKEEQIIEPATKTSKEKVEHVFKEMIALFKTPEMRKRTLNIYFSWMVVAGVYYGLSFNTKNIGGDIYISNFIAGMAEVVACVLIIPALNRFGRVKCYSGTFLIGGLACIAVAVILWTTDEGSLVWLIITLSIKMKGPWYG
ncbi:organic cation transporter protein isoform X3 [Eurytemora carolleeae]|uniref:organic cation transporter protein isoform X3 n=1 Tax=Eurytemora carolleeae TaxID=1294199 RepID=UPI000C7866C8|nr:organic cation transporter protein isoform X3 [Eurytemora carolleeae]|eukprot:XP_023324223.1 organic cation transporter protein-like isoform X3 [Eurytemora affinis]